MTLRLHMAPVWVHVAAALAVVSERPHVGSDGIPRGARSTAVHHTAKASRVAAALHAGLHGAAPPEKPFRTLKTLRRAAEQLRKKTQNPSSRQRRTRRSKNFGSRTRAALSTAVDHMPNANVHAGAGAGKCGVLWFLHISKTGGSSYHAYLEKKLERRELDALWEFWSKGEKPYRPISFETNLKPKLDQLVANPNGRLVAVHHHHGAPGMHVLMPVLQEYRKRLEQKGCNLFLTTIVRSPDEWMKSKMSYNLKSYHMVNEAAREKEWRRMLHEKGFDNGELRYILNNLYGAVPEAYPIAYGSVDAAVTDRVFEILQGFDVVGFTSTFDEFVRKVDSLAGFAHTAVPNKNKTPKEKSRAVDRMPADLLALAHERTAQDKELYTRLWDRGMQEMLTQRKPMLLLKRNDSAPPESTSRVDDAIDIDDDDD